MGSFAASGFKVSILYFRTHGLLLPLNHIHVNSWSHILCFIFVMQLDVLRTASVQKGCSHSLYSFHHWFYLHLSHFESKCGRCVYLSHQLIVCLKNNLHQSSDIILCWVCFGDVFSIVNINCSKDFGASLVFLCSPNCTYVSVVCGFHLNDGETCLCLHWGREQIAR